MKLTCVTATFNVLKAGNRERLIKCVESVAALRTEHEHLIYDGASTDGTRELLQELALRFPNLKVVSEKDTGIYNALNKGVRDARGDWFYVLGADDYILFPNVMDDIVQSLDDAIGLHLSPVLRDDGGLWFSGITDFRYFAFGNVCPHQGALVRTALMRKYDGFDEGNPISADYDLFWKLHKNCEAIRYSMRVFTMFHCGGASSDFERNEQCDRPLIMKHLHLTEAQVCDRRIKSVPIIKTMPLIWSKNEGLRMCGRYLLWRRLKFFAKMLLFKL